MSGVETEDHESVDISDALINEAARLENEYRDQETEELESAPIESVTEDDNLESALKGESLEPVLAEPDTSSRDATLKADSPAKRETSLTPEKKKVENSSLKRKATDDSLESIRPQPPDAKPLKKGFKIPKLSKQGAGVLKPVLGLSDDQKQFLVEIEKDFSNRYTDEDEDYKKATEVRFSPPLVENFFCPPRRQFNRPEGSSHHDRNNRNSSPYGHSPRYSQYPPKYSRDYPNNRDGREYRDRDRDYSNNRDSRDYNRDRDFSSNRDGRDFSNNRDRDRDYSSSRHHQRHQQRYQPY